MKRYRDLQQQNNILKRAVPADLPLTFETESALRQAMIRSDHPTVDLKLETVQGLRLLLFQVERKASSN